MCIIVPGADHVSKTKIFVAPAGIHKTHQLTVYSNNVTLPASYSTNLEPMAAGGGLYESVSKPTSTRPAAMILPFPNKSKSGVRLVNLENYKNIFEELDSLFPPEPRTRGGGWGKQSLSNGSDFLAVHTVGSYSVSVAQDLSDLDRLRQDVFKLEGNVKKMFQDFYPQDFGFVVCIMRENAAFHPIGYVHEIMRNDLNKNGTEMYYPFKLFIPTRHYHGHVETNPDWDHTIYVMNSDKVSVHKGAGVKLMGIPLNKCPIDQTKLKYINGSEVKLCSHPVCLTRIKVHTAYGFNHDIIAEETTSVDPRHNTSLPTTSSTSRMRPHPARSSSWRL